MSSNDFKTRCISVQSCFSRRRASTFQFDLAAAAMRSTSFLPCILFVMKWISQLVPNSQCRKSARQGRGTPNEGGLIGLAYRSMHQTFFRQEGHLVRHCHLTKVVSRATPMEEKLLYSCSTEITNLLYKVEQKTSLSSVTHVPSGLIGCASAALG